MIHPRRMAGLFLAVLFCLAGARAAALADGRERETVTEADALRIASEAVRQAVSLSDDEFASLTPAARRTALDGHSGDVWEVSFLLTSGSYAIGVYELTVEPYTGGILLAAIPEDAYENALREAEGYKVLEEWRQTKGDSYFWTMEDEVWLQQTYFDGLYRMPGDGDLSEEEAITLAQKYAADELKLTREYLDSLHPCARLYADTAREKGTWIVYLVDRELFSADGYLAPHIIVLRNPGGELVSAVPANPEANG